MTCKKVTSWLPDWFVFSRHTVHDAVRQTAFLKDTIASSSLQSLPPSLSFSFIPVQLQTTPVPYSLDGEDWRDRLDGSCMPYSQKTRGTGQDAGKNSSLSLAPPHGRGDCNVVRSSTTCEANYIEYAAPPHLACVLFMSTWNKYERMTPGTSRTYEDAGIDVAISRRDMNE